jgi:hypothetical protein
MVIRQQRLNEFNSDSQPPAGELRELLCEDHNGTYVLPFPSWRPIGPFLICWPSAAAERQRRTSLG